MRFIAAASPAVDRQFTAEWLRRMAAHRAAQQVPGQHDSKWGPAPTTSDLGVAAFLSPQPEMSGVSVSSDGDDVFVDVFRPMASYSEALWLAFIVVDVLLVSYHMTRTCLSAHALWTVGLRKRVMLRVADIASLQNCDGRHVSGGAVGIRAVIVPSEPGDDGDVRTHPVVESLSVANHRDDVLPPTLANYSAADVYQYRHSQTTHNTAGRKLQPPKVKKTSFYLI